MTDNTFDKIKKLMKIIGGKVIIVEDGTPTMVVINVDEYFRVDKIKDDRAKVGNTEKNLERINLDINTWKKRQEERRMKQIEDNLNLEHSTNRPDPINADCESDSEMVIEGL